MGHIMGCTTKVGSGVTNTATDLNIHMIHPGTEKWKSLGSFIGYLKGKETKVVIVRNPKVLRRLYFLNRTAEQKNKPERVSAV